MQGRAPVLSLSAQGCWRGRPRSCWRRRRLVICCQLESGDSDGGLPRVDAGADVPVWNEYALSLRDGLRSDFGGNVYAEQAGAVTCTFSHGPGQGRGFRVSAAGSHPVF
jgi:hypothetical protein